MTAKEDAIKLLKQLKDRVQKNPHKYGENYGVREVRKFEEKWSNKVGYKELAEAVTIVEEIYSWSPLQ